MLTSALFVSCTVALGLLDKLRYILGRQFADELVMDEEKDSKERQQMEKKRIAR